MSKYLEEQLSFVLEIDKLKSVLRKSAVKSAGNRAENSAEHSWHVALMALVLKEHANEPIDILKVVKMLLIHDIVEIDAGDVIIYDHEARRQQEIKEKQAAERLFGSLPGKEGQEFKSLWFEFEAAESAEAKFAKSLDRLAPLMLNYHNQGKSWQENNINKEQVVEINRQIDKGSQTLWTYAQSMIEDAVQKGWLK
ncbi:HD domain-containing protein [Vibrio salinus]|uniref:HD domain-containing protein n=1 Tax=Vibrio salinus TaxID=2899784 RepID=UPI001E484D56|nr:HD domain-containing protein [Vibrio salinus]MCE0492462.1 HD domain-containing protein [Vibrio salinus]